MCETSESPTEVHEEERNQTSFLVLLHPKHTRGLLFSYRYVQQPMQRTYVSRVLEFVIVLVSSVETLALLTLNRSSPTEEPRHELKWPHSATGIYAG